MVGGAEEIVLNLVRHLPSRFEPMVCCIHEAGPMGEEIRKTGTPVAVLGLNPGIRRPQDIGGIPSLLRSEGPRLVKMFLRLPPKGQILRSANDDDLLRQASQSTR